MEDTKELTLRKPITIGDKTYNSLTLSEPTAGVLEKSGSAPNVHASNVIVIAEMAKVPIAVVRQLCKRDYDEACELLASFSPAALETGAS